MIRLRKSQDRGYADHGWLKSHHSFSFAGYFDPAFMHWGKLRVLNEDFIAPGTGFGTHGHRDMEIVTYVLSGELAHKDSLGHIKTIPAGDVQRMSAGTGVKHSEFNHSGEHTTHLMQIWFTPERNGLPPGYEQKSFATREKRGALRLIASRDGTQDSVTLHADVAIHAGLFDGKEQAELSLNRARKAYVHLARGRLSVNGLALVAGDALFIEDESRITLDQGFDAEVLVFDLGS